MRLLTLNTHSLEEEYYEKKLNQFVDAIISEKPDIIALQEINQSQKESILPIEELEGMETVQKRIPVRRDNHVANAARLLSINGLHYNWIWLPIKTGYGKYDEGIALMTKSPIEKTDVILISNNDDYDDWKTRKVLGVKTNGQWFYSVHMGWWNDKEEPFINQWNKINNHLIGKQDVWLMGDFNNRDDLRGEGYDYITSSGWYDTYSIAKEKDLGFTVEKTIDGWNTNEKMRIDYIWKNNIADIVSSKVIFNGINHPIISDHYGIIIDVK